MKPGLLKPSRCSPCPSWKTSTTIPTVAPVASRFMSTALIGSTTLRMARTYRAPAQAVFDAWTSEEVIRRWWHAEHDWETSEAEVDLRVGGAVRVVMRNPHDDAEYGGGGLKVVIDCGYDPTTIAGNVFTGNVAAAGDGGEVNGVFGRHLGGGRRRRHSAGLGRRRFGLGRLLRGLFGQRSGRGRQHEQSDHGVFHRGLSLLKFRVSW